MSEQSLKACDAIRDVLGRVGERRSSLVIAMLSGGTCRFDELRRTVDGISQRMLTVTLRNLERDGFNFAGFFWRFHPEWSTG